MEVRTGDTHTQTHTDAHTDAHTHTHTHTHTWLLAGAQHARLACSVRKLTLVCVCVCVCHRILTYTEVLTLNESTPWRCSMLRCVSDIHTACTGTRLRQCVCQGLPGCFVDVCRGVFAFRYVCPLCVGVCVSLYRPPHTNCRTALSRTEQLGMVYAHSAAGTARALLYSALSMAAR